MLADHDSILATSKPLRTSCVAKWSATAAARLDQGIAGCRLQCGQRCLSAILQRGIQGDGHDFRATPGEMIRDAVQRNAASFSSAVYHDDRAGHQLAIAMLGEPVQVSAAARAPSSAELEDQDELIGVGQQSLVRAVQDSVPVSMTMRL